MSEVSENKPAITFESSNFLMFLFKWRKVLIIIGIATAIVSAGVSLLIRNKYQSTVVMFPSSTNAVSKALISTTGSGKEDIMEFGEENQAEQMLQILNSNEIRQRIIKKYKLFEHYRIDEDSKYKYTKLYQTYSENITFKRTEYMGVEIKVMDEDPQVAADIANDIANLFDTVKIEMQRQRSGQGFQIVKKTYEDLASQIKVKEDSLDWLRRKGINDYESQAERLTEALAREIGRGNNAAINAIQQRIDTLSKYGSAYVSLRDQLEYEKRQLTEMKAKYEEAKIDAESALPQKFVVDYAFKAEKKSYPVRWLIVVVSTFATFVMSIIVLILLENYRKFKVLQKG